MITAQYNFKTLHGSYNNEAESLGSGEGYAEFKGGGLASLLFTLSSFGLPHAPCLLFLMS
jgi:hypothetical protein